MNGGFVDLINVSVDVEGSSSLIMGVISSVVGGRKGREGRQCMRVCTVRWDALKTKKRPKNAPRR